jgi:isocitrate lyase
MSSFPQIERWLTSWANEVQAEMQREVVKVSGKLAGSIRVRVEEDIENEITIKFDYLKYGDYLDKGVSGTQNPQSYTDRFGSTQPSPYAYTNSPGHSQPPSSALDKWGVMKGLAPRTSGGQFMKRKGLNYVIARSIGLKGIKSISWFSKPLGEHIKKLPPAFGPEFKVALLDFIKQEGEYYTLKE